MNNVEERRFISGREVAMDPILAWSSKVTNEEIYRISRDPTHSGYRWAMDQILNFDDFENIERMFSPQEILDVLPYVSLRPESRKIALETALSFWSKGIHHAYPAANENS